MRGLACGEEEEQGARHRVQYKLEKAVSFGSDKEITRNQTKVT